jgi:hypothetical protein
VEIQSQSFTGCVLSATVFIKFSADVLKFQRILLRRERGYKAATKLQWALDRIKLGSILPLQSLYVLRGDFELWEAIGDLVRGQSHIAMFPGWS